MDTAVSLTGMEYGGITPVGLPADWPILVDQHVIDQERVVIGSGIRGSKLLASTAVLASLPGAEVLALTKAD
jgi:prolyl-tRNA editing enzyme YbaK/EbsC (Cys-tRNA(Pro) deacylase)